MYQYEIRHGMSREFIIKRTEPAKCPSRQGVFIKRKR